MDKFAPLMRACQRQLMFYAFLCIAMVFSCGTLSAQMPKKLCEAGRCIAPPKVNGVLDDPVWQDIQPATNFITRSPDPGKNPRFDSEVRIAYDDVSIYIAFMCFDTDPDSILSQLTGRDSDGNADYCGITFSCYKDGINGFTFAVTPKAEQWDARVTSGSSGEFEDPAWNAVWDCKTSIQPNGWCAEYRIPFAALRFPEAANQVWDINFFREIRRYREQSFWNPVDPQLPGVLLQMGELHGISDVVTPTRLFLYPYASAYLNVQEVRGDDGTISPKQTTSYNGGMDLKYGLSDAFTLDATLVPDFGQTVSDNLVLNLTPFEVFFQENRQFFTEGTEMFSKAGLFYSRRVGGTPVYAWDVYSMLEEGETLVKNPLETQLINAAKVSGRTTKGLGVGLFNAVTAPQHAEVQRADGSIRHIETNPLTNYNVLVFDQNLPNNSYVSLVNTNVLRNGHTYDANAVGTEFQIRNKGNSYAVSGSGVFNQKFNYAGTDKQGFSSSLSLEKTSGNLTWGTGASMMSDTYDINDLGFLYNNNQRSHWIYGSYQIFKPFGPFNRLWSNLNGNLNYLYNPNHFSDFSLYADVGLMTRTFFSFGIEGGIVPVNGYDFFEPRVDGLFFRTYKNGNAGWWISTDYRKRLALDIGSWASFYENDGRYSFNWRFAPRFRVNDHLMITYVYSHQNHFNDIGWADFTGENGDEPVFGTRDVISHTNVLTMNYAFNNVMTLSFRGRHYWGYSDYSGFHSLTADGWLGSTDYNELDEAGNYEANRSFNSFSIDMVYRWIFAPGSELNLVWKRNIADEQNDIPSTLIDDMKLTFRLPESNSVSIKVLYFLDYQMIFKGNRSGLSS